ncbi:MULTISPECIES: hypothetical protein [Vibrio]|uniref:AraC family transcriptional regulator n=1 Tax=Vibrio genomosp. F6 str. FF-238 TaxID=1191298 RepID=A0A1E5D6M1_9VIBR|nr:MULTISPECIES: hypothetical protein [Vibrio]RBW64620.1 AraC family transcriptional regulator [Vibrionales bacterium C3R12]MDN3697110.1 AraC family transcriptional regulator [Vibrio cortegadensis]NOH82279.1 AraC family transcriptional regulator [Vibrio sp. 03-59-1]OEE79274.1 AraC family transcriptional regulator [Vibrio genomosp. F6 str. FF-238]TKF21698.1 AraC family transcriptional regulator [Vibrio genomosp. F6]
MNYAIEHQNTSYPYLVITPRKKVLKHSLITVQSGLLLIKLGKTEYAIEQGETIWVPFDCLTSITFFPNTHIQRVDFSIRLTDKFPTQSGLVRLSELSRAVLNKLTQKKLSPQHEKDLLAVLKEEVLSLQPTLIETQLSREFNQWEPGKSSDLEQINILVMTMRESKKRLQSGQKKALIIEQLFSGKEEEFEQLCLLVFGSEL